jgi:hypothetical protein
MRHHPDCRKSSWIACSKSSITDQQSVEIAMKIVLAAMVLLSAINGAHADVLNIKKYRIADSSDACFANCSNQNASCKRVCPTTFNTPCLSACDSQAQTCRQSCQPR